jgi:hypothetical protein
MLPGFLGPNLWFVSSKWYSLLHAVSVEILSGIIKILLSGGLPSSEKIKTLERDDIKQQIDETKISIQNRIKKQKYFNKNNPDKLSSEKQLEESLKHGDRQNANGSILNNYKRDRRKIPIRE